LEASLATESGVNAFPYVCIVKTPPHETRVAEQAKISDKAADPRPGDTVVVAKRGGWCNGACEGDARLSYLRAELLAHFASDNLRIARKCCISFSKVASVQSVYDKSSLEAAHNIRLSNFADLSFRLLRSALESRPKKHLEPSIKQRLKSSLWRKNVPEFSPMQLRRLSHVYPQSLR
jgi:hypothetical protein